MILPHTCKTPTTFGIAKLDDGTFVGPFHDFVEASLWCEQFHIKAEASEMIDPGFYRQKLDLDFIEQALKDAREQANGNAEQLEIAQLAFDRVIGYFRP